MIPKIQLRDNFLKPVGEVEDFEELKVVLRFNAMDTWELRGMHLTDNFDRPGITGIIIKLDNTVITNGPIWAYGEDWSENADYMNLGGFSDDFWMFARVLLPVITGPPYTAAAYDISTLPAESSMHYWVNRNAGPAAKTERRVYGLTMATDLARGLSTVGGGRFHNLGETLTGIAIQNAAKGGVELGWNITQIGITNLQFGVFAPTDKSNTIKFSSELGNLEAWTFEEKGPEVNYAIVGGSGEGTARVFVEGGDSQSIVRWGRIEQFVDQRQTSDLTELGQSRDENLLEGKGSARLELTPIETSQFQFIRDYYLGDKVTVLVGGVPTVDIIREVEITITPDGNVEVQPKVGTADQRGPIGLFYQMQQLRKKIKNLERR